jgi:hypothetical protein
MVKRYEIDLSNGARGGTIGRMIANPIGRWVSYTDYRELKAENDRLTTALVRADSQSDALKCSTCGEIGCGGADHE